MVDEFMTCFVEKENFMNIFFEEAECFYEQSKLSRNHLQFFRLISTKSSPQALAKFVKSVLDKLDSDEKKAQFLVVMLNQRND